MGKFFNYVTTRQHCKIRRLTCRALYNNSKQLHYMERTIAALRTNTTKNSERIRIENGIKTKENTHLIDDLNRLKFENKKQSVILQKKKEEYKRLEHDQSKLVKERNMVYHEYNQMLQRREQRVQSGSREDGDRRQEGRAGSSKGPRQSSAVRANNEQQKQDDIDKAKIQELNQLIEANNQEIIDNWKKISYIKGKIR